MSVRSKCRQEGGKHSIMRFTDTAESVILPFVPRKANANSPIATSWVICFFPAEGHY
jgi:hypothetical protein